MMVRDDVSHRDYFPALCACVSDRGAEGLDVTVTMGSLPGASVTMPLQG